MPIVTIDVVPKYESSKEKILNDLYWYNSEEQKMCHYKGTRLSFNYIDGKVVVNPIVDISPIKIRKDNSEEILKWAEIHSVYGVEVVDADNKEVILSFPNENKELIESLMYSERFRYEIRDTDVKS